MTSDYLKQLQLTKQLEQKAKEAAKNRKAAEEKFAQAEKLLAEAAGMDIAVDDLRKGVAAAQEAQSRRDYSAALAAITKVVEVAQQVQKSKVAKELEAPLSVLALIRDPGEERLAVEALVADARKEMAEARYPSALTITHKANDVAESYANHRMSAMFTQVQKLLALAEKKELPVTAGKQLLGKAMKLKEDGDLEGSLSKVGTCFKDLQEAFSKLLEEKASAVLDMVREASPSQGDISSVTSLIDQARAALADGRIEEAFDRMAESERAIIPIVVAAVETRLGSQQERADWLRGMQIEVGRFEEARLKAESAASQGNGEEAVEWLRVAEKALWDGEIELVLRHITELRPRLRLARKIKADIAAILEKLEEVRHVAVFGKGREALDLVAIASAELDNVLAGHRQLAEELERTRMMFIQARRQRIFSKEAANMVARAREQALSGKLGDSRTELEGARSALNTKAVEVCAPDLLNAELMVARGLSIGADIDGASRDLEEVSADLREGRIDRIRIRLAETVARLDDRLASATIPVVEAANRMTDPALGLAEMARARGKFDDAKSLLLRREWYQAYILAEKARGDACSVQRSTLERGAVQASTLLAVARELEMPTQAFDDILAERSCEKNDFASSLQAMSEVVRRARASVREEVVHSQTALARDVSAARKNGVRTAPVDGLLEQLSKALARDEAEKGYNLLLQARRELEMTIALHASVYDDIVALSRSSTELHLPSSGNAGQLLSEMKRLFEAGRYTEAKAVGERCRREIEVVGAEALAPRLMKEARNMVTIIQQLGLPSFKFEDALREIDSLISKKRHHDALTWAKDALADMTRTAEEQIRGEIAAVRRDLGEEGWERGTNAAEMIIDRAESLLAQKHYSDAVRAVRFAIGEIGQVKAVKVSALQEMEAAEGSIEEVARLRINVNDAVSTLAQARAYLPTQRYNLVLELSRRASQIARAGADEHYHNALAAVEAKVDLGALKGHDLDAAAGYRSTFLRTVEQHRYAEASTVLEMYRDALATISQLREQCTSSLSKLAENMVRVPAGSTFMNEAARALDDAQESFAAGAFRECLALTEECRAAGAAATQWHDTCSKRLNEFESGLLTGEGRRSINEDIASLMAEARRALQGGRYEEMDRSILRAARLRARSEIESGRREAAELINLLRMYPRVKLKVDDLPSMAKELLDRPLSEVAVSRNLSEVVGAVHARLRKGIEENIEAVRTKAERSKRYSSVSLSLIPIAERSLAEEKLEQAIVVISDAERGIGASMADVQELRSLAKRYAELEEVAESLGIVPGPFVDLHRQSLRARDLTTAQQRLRAAVNALEKATSPSMPRLEVRSGALINRGRSPALSIRMTEGSRRAQELFTVLWPARPASLPRDVSPKSRMGVSYRMLFLARPLEAVIEPAD